ncbi:MAG: glycosyltransferase family 4 protein [Lutimaribacter sp.]
MPTTDLANAAIWYAQDGYSPITHGINGRRVAGASFLQGFLRHADADRFYAIVQNETSGQAFKQTAADHAPNTPVELINRANTQRLGAAGVVSFPSPNFATELWRRYPLGDARYSLCGITHTTATKAVMNGMFELCTAPLQPWDGLICTSRAVHASMQHQMSLIDDYARARFGKAPPRPQMPVIPLGIDCAAFTPSQAARHTLRANLGLGPNDVLVLTLSRLAPYGKFDPFPLFLALQDAQQQLGAGQRLHYMTCGIYLDDHSREVFETGAANLMPDVGYHHLDGSDAALRHQALSGADIFAFPIDNVQETFGLAPIEAMAAGLPVIVSDWDGMRDTVAPDVGIAVPSRALSARHSYGEGVAHAFDSLAYHKYTNSLSALPELDLGALVQAILALARNPDLRQKMGAAGPARARSLYDWAAVIPQMQRFWAELNARRAKDAPQTAPKPAQTLPRELPIAPNPMGFFAGYPTQILPAGVADCVALAGADRLRQLYSLRRFQNITPSFEKLDTLLRALEALQSAGPQGANAQQLSKMAGLSVLTCERCFAWILKYGIIARKTNT